MRRLMLALAALLLGAWGLTACGEAGGDAGSTGSLTAANTLDFSATTVAGEDFDGSSLEGKPTVLWFWAPWCPTCKGQVDGVSDLADTYGDQVNVVGVGSLDDASAIEGFAEAVPSDFTQLTDPDGAVWRHFGVTAQSTYIVLDTDTSVVTSGYLSDDELASTVADLTN